MERVSFAGGASSHLRTGTVGYHVHINRAPNEASGYKILQQPESSRLALDEISVRNDLVLFLSALSNFSLVSISVSRRTREIGLRGAG